MYTYLTFTYIFCYIYLFTEDVVDAERLELEGDRLEGIGESRHQVTYIHTYIYSFCYIYICRQSTLSTPSALSWRVTAWRKKEKKRVDTRLYIFIYIYTPIYVAISISVSIYIRRTWLTPSVLSWRVTA